MTAANRKAEAGNETVMRACEPFGMIRNATREKDHTAPPGENA